MPTRAAVAGSLARASTPAREVAPADETERPDTLSTAASTSRSSSRILRTCSAASEGSADNGAIVDGRIPPTAPGALPRCPRGVGRGRILGRRIASRGRAESTS